MFEDLSQRQQIGVGALAAIAVIALLASVATIGSAAELGNETVDVQDENDSIEISIAWNESITDPANESATVEIYNETAYSDDPANATALLTETVDADEGNTTSTAWNVSDEADLEAGESYRVLVDGNDSAIDDVAISVDGDDDGLLAPIQENAGNVALLAILVGVAALAYRRR